MAYPCEIAVVGVGCRFPGGVSSPADFWKLLEDGRDAIVPVPEERWDNRRFHSSDSPCPPGKSYLREGGFLEESIFDFDPEFFSISPREAEALDPQQRLMLEVSYEALEDAGFRMEDLRRRRVGVFVGGFALDNMSLRTRKETRACMESTDAMGFSMTLLANRLSHFYDWTGPSMAIDTACSSSLVAVHEAIASLLRGESEMAVAGGVNVVLCPESSTVMSRGGFLSPRCRCRAFDRSADGYVRSEGAGVVFLKPLSTAQKDGNHIHAVIRGSAVNQDGRTAGIALPNPESQKRLLREVYEQSGIAPERINFIEAHGTGTAAGDRAELGSIHSVFSPVATQPLPVSSVKTNLGHLEAAAGIAGLIKSVLCLQHGQLPPHLHLEDPVPELAPGTGLVCPVGMMSLPDSETRLLAGVNSFGYGGTNAHVILEEAPRDAVSGVEDPGQSIPAVRDLVRLSAGSREALQTMAERHACWIDSRAERFPDWKRTLMSHRSRHRFMLTVPSDDVDRAGDSLRLFASTGQPGPGSIVGTKKENPGPIAFVFSGMGPQWWGMGRELFDLDPAFAGAVEECDRIFRDLSGWSIREEMLADREHSRMEEPRVAQPANFCLQVALAAMWKAWGISPDAVVGHSVGEVSAAYLCGALTLEEAVTVSFHRSRLQHSLRGSGSMLAVGLGEKEILEWIEGLEGVSLAAVNSPGAVTLAGDRERLEDLSRELSEAGIFERSLDVDVPYHSQKMDPLRAELRESLGGLSPSPAGVPIYSTVTGDRLEGEHCGPGYWWSNVRMPVRFEAAVERMISSGFRVFLELGPHPVLTRSLREIAENAGCEIQAYGSLRKGESARSEMQRARGLLDFAGYKLPEPSGGSRVSLPAYPWRKRKFWRVTESVREDFGGRPGSHVFLQERGSGAADSWETEWNNLFFPYLEDHVIAGKVVWPGAAFVEAGLALNLEINRGEPATLQGIRFHRMLHRERGVRQRLLTAIDPTSGSWSVSCGREVDPTEWTGYASGVLLKKPLRSEPLRSEPLPVEPARESVEETAPGGDGDGVDVDAFYSRLFAMGLEYGETLRCVRRVTTNGPSIFVEIVLPQSVKRPDDHYQIHPVLLDAVFQAFAMAAFADTSSDTWVPAEIEWVHFFREAGHRISATIEITRVEESRITGNADLRDAGGKAVARLEGVTCRKAPVSAAARRQWNYQPMWKESADGEDPERETLRGATLLVRPPESMEGVWGDGIRHALTGEVVECRWMEASDPGALGGRIRRALEKRNGERLAQIVFVAASRGDEEGEESLWNLLELVRCDSMFTGDGTSPVLTVVTTGSFATGDGRSPLSLSGAAVWGVGAVIANEYPSVSLRCLDLPAEMEAGTAALLERELQQSLSGEEILLRNGKRLLRSWDSAPPPPAVPETEPVPVSGEERDCLVLCGSGTGGAAGVYHSRSERRAPEGEEVEIEVAVAGLNFKDLLKVTGRIPPQALDDTFFGNSLGLECSGVVLRVGDGVKTLQPGQRVAAFSREGCFRSHVVTSEEFVFPLPDHIDFEDGACLVPWVTAWYSLHDAARLQEGETVLIHSAAGAVGLAALQIAKAAGAVVFATASSESKRSFLREQGADHVLSSGSLEFAGEVLHLTNGRGVDVVLNSLPGEFLRTSFSLLASYGRFIEIGKRDIVENRDLPMQVFNRNASFVSIDLDRMLVERPEWVKRAIGDCLGLLHEDRFTPLPRETFPAVEAGRALASLGDRSRIGRVNLRYADESAAVEITEKKTRIRSGGAYLITGGTGGLGLSLAKWLADCGVRHLILLGRRGLFSEEAVAWSTEFAKNGGEILAPPTDISDQVAMERVFGEFHSREWHLAGVFHCALELEDARVEDITREMIHRIFAAKVRGALVLESLLEREPELDLWVAFSSVATLLGNPGQAVYVAANAWLEQFAERRQRQGKPSMTLLLGMIGDTGVASRSNHVVRHLESAGLRGMDSRRVAETLPELFDRSLPVQGFFDLDWESWGKMSVPVSTWHRFSRLVSAGRDEEMGARFRELRNEVRGMEQGRRVEYLESRIAGVLSDVLSVPPDGIDPGIPLSQLGVDSLMAMELISGAREKLGIRFSESDLAKDPTLSGLGRQVLRTLVSEDKQ